MLTSLAVALGGAGGGILRYALSGWVARKIGETFPWGTLVVNVTGCFAIGLAEPLLAEDSLLRAAILTGVLGGYTTVSSFSLQTLTLMREAAWSRAFVNCLLSLVLTLAAAAGGMLAGKALGLS